MTTYALVGDVGGTNARLALCALDTGELSQIKTYTNDEFASLEAVLQHYLAEQTQAIKHACIAIACPVQGDVITMTNRDWAFSIQQMQANLQLERLEVINDFTAVSMAIPMLKTEDVLQFGGDKAQEGKAIAVFGAGTGLGVAHLVHAADRWVSLPGEGGHVDYAPTTEEEAVIHALLREELGHVSAERILSGQGLVNLYRSIVTADQRIAEDLGPKEVSERAVEGNCTDCRRALSLFCVIMGRFAGNLALNLGTFGGVYIAGGIVPRFLPFFQASGFRQAFEDKGRFKAYVQPIPVFLITHEQPGLLGAGAHLRQELGQHL